MQSSVKISKHLRDKSRFPALDSAANPQDVMVLPPFVSVGPAEPRHPVLLAVPHAGRDYPAAMVNRVRLPIAQLQGLEDRYADRLASAAITAGFQAIIAQSPRAWIDLNRAEHEFDPGFVEPPVGLRAVPTRKVAAGLGIIPRRVSSGGEIWRGPIKRDDFEARLDGVYRPYHAAIAASLADYRDRFGCAILIDLHSMPPLMRGSAPAPDIVVGDLFGRSAERWVSDCVVQVATRAGYRAALNAPYAGGNSVERHGAPKNAISAVQVEMSRSLYLDSTRTHPGPGLARASRFIADLAAALADAAFRLALPVAAE